MSIDQGIIERRARQSVARTVALSLSARSISEDMRARVARYRWRQMRIAVHSCERWAHVRDRLTARWLLWQDAKSWCTARVRRHMDWPIAGPVGRLP